MIATRRRFSLLISLLLLVALPAVAAKKTSTAPGKYEEWGPDIDRIEIVKTFRFASYDKVVVETLDTSATPSPADEDMKNKVAKVLATSTKPFLEGVRDKIPTASLSAGEKAPGTLIIRAKLTSLDPGSRAKRMFVGYGAGGASAAISGEIVDGGTGEVLVRFQQERRSGMERFGRGSSYEEILNRTLTAIGEDVSNLLHAF